MKKLLFVALVISISPCAAQTVAGTTAPATEPSARDRIKAEREKDKAVEKADTQIRPWDRDANGKRPWDVKEPVTK